MLMWISKQWDKLTLCCPDQLQLHAVWTVPACVEIVVETWFGKGEQRNRWEKKWNGHWKLNDTAMGLIQVELRQDEWMTPCLMPWDHFRCMELQCNSPWCIGAGPAGPVLAGPLFRRFIIIDICACAFTDSVPYTHAYCSLTTSKSFLRPWIP